MILHDRAFSLFLQHDCTADGGAGFAVGQLVHKCPVVRLLAKIIDLIYST